MSKQLSPILIGFPLSGDFKQKILALNACLSKDKIDFTKAIPHLTLWMGFVKDKQIKSLHLGLENIFKNIQVELKINELELFEGDFGKVWSVSFHMSRELYLLQNRIHHFFEPFRERASSYDDFGAETIKYINSFNEKSMENYSPHLTVGFGDFLLPSFKEEVIQFTDPKMFLMGNYCTCIQEVR